MPLELAEFYSLDGEQYSFSFQINPSKISFNNKSNITEDRGARTKKGIPKSSFASVNATTIELKDITIDAFERMGNRDVSEEMKRLSQMIKFIDGAKRPPMFMFRWGRMSYLKCYVEALNYRATMFLRDGTPVRLNVNLTLKEVDTTDNPCNPPSNSSERRNLDSRWN